MIYVALLRGINVNGQKKITMDLLLEAFEEMGFENVRTYIQTGNVIFICSEQNKNSLCYKIEIKIKEKFNFEVPVILRTLDDLKYAIEENPFKEIKLKENEKLHITFLNEPPKEEAEKSLILYKDEKDIVKFRGNNVYILCRDGYGKTKFSNSFLEKKLKVLATTRNFATLNKIISIMEEELSQN